MTSAPTELAITMATYPGRYSDDWVTADEVRHRLRLLGFDCTSQFVDHPHGPHGPRGRAVARGARQRVGRSEGVPRLAVWTSATSRTGCPACGVRETCRSHGSGRRW
jgi:hypothetical protein